MPHVDIPDTWSVVLEWELPLGASAANVLHYVDPGAGFINDPATIPDLIMTAFNGSGYKSRLSAGAALRKVILTDISSEFGDQYVSTHAAIFGTNGNAILPGQAALCTTLYTTLRSRSGRGRIYWPGFTEGNSDGRPDGTVVTDVHNFLDAINNIMFALDHGVASRKLQLTHVVTSRRTLQAWRSQRRRELV